MSPTELFADNFTTQLAAPVGIGDSTITVTGPVPSSLLATGQFRILVDSELMLVTSSGSLGTTWSVTRGVGTGESPTPTPAAHAAGVAVSQVFTEAAIANALSNAGTIPVGIETARAQAAETAEVTRATTAEATKVSSSALTAETSRATTAEGTNASAISAETTRAQGAESSEATRATTAEATKASSSALTSETSRATAAEGTNASAISTETTRAQGAESAETTRATTAEGTKAAASALTAETTRATTAEGTNATAISTETTRAQAAEAAREQGLVRTSVKSSAYTAAPGDSIPVDISTANVTVTLPTAPADGSRVLVKVITINATPGTFSLTITAGGSDVFNKAGGSTSLVLTAQFQGVTLKYNTATSIWTVQSTDTPLGVPLGAAKLGADGTLTGAGGSGLPASVVKTTSPDSVIPPHVPVLDAWVDMCRPPYNCTPATQLTVTLNGTTTATVTAGSAPASGAIIAPGIPTGTTFTASGATLTLSNAATLSSSQVAWAGMDITTALQTAINAANAASQDTTIYFSALGIYNLNGAQQSGTAIGYSYSGQILFPARHYTTGAVMVRIKGQGPITSFATVAGEGGAISGVVLLSSAAAGAIMDAIPADTASGGQTFTDIGATFEDIAIRAPANPLCSGLKLSGLERLKFRGSTCVDTTVPGGQVGTLSGTGVGVAFPPNFNQALSEQEGDMLISGFPYGFSHYEHFICSNLLLNGCNVGALPSAGLRGHASQYRRLLIQGCAIGIQPAGSGGHVQGFIDVGDPGGAQALQYVINDPTNVLYGNLQVAAVSYNVNDTVQLGIPVNGAQNVRLVPYVGRTSDLPFDSFTRLGYGANSGLGTTDATLHPYSYPTAGNSTNVASNFTTAANSAKCGGALFQAEALAKYLGSRPSFSRVIRVVATLGASGYAPFINIGAVVTGGGSSTTGNRLQAWLSGGTVTLFKIIAGTSTQLAVSAGGVVLASTKYTIDTVVSNPISAAGLWSATVFLNGTQVLTYTLTGTDAGQLLDTEARFTQDGFGIYRDLNTVVSEFAVMPN